MSLSALCEHRPVGIVGLGLIGGSLGLDLQAAGLEVHALVHREATAVRARERGLANRIGTDPGLLEACGLVVLALPLDRLLDPDPRLLDALPATAVLTDVGSVKGTLLSCWRERLAGAGRGDQASRFVPGHPMAGTASSGVEAGEAGLFRGRPWLATPDPDTAPEAIALVRALAETVGAHWFLCAPVLHDRAAALISHLPVLAGAALLAVADRAGDDPETAALARFMASSGFADTTRVGGGNPELGLLMARTNRPALLQALAAYRSEIETLERLVSAEAWPALSERLQQAQTQRPAFLRCDPAAAARLDDSFDDAL